MEMIDPHPSGFMEQLPRRQAQFERFWSHAPESTALWLHRAGHARLESVRGAAGQGGGETEKQIYRFTKGDAT